MPIPLTVPTVNSDNGTWGTTLNSALNSLNNADRFVYKPSDQSVTSSITLTDDTALTLTLPVGTFVVNGTYLMTGAQAADVRIAWAFSGTAATSFRGGQGPGINTTDAIATGAAGTTSGPMRGAAGGASSSAITGVAAYGTDNSAQSHIQEAGLLVVTVAGVLKVQFCQNASTASATTMKAGSFLWARQVA